MTDLKQTIASDLTTRYQKLAAVVRELAAPLSEEQFWAKPFAFGNSFGHLVLHLTGNLNYYIGTQIAGTGYVRNRPLEFSDVTKAPKAEVLKKFDLAPIGNQLVLGAGPECPTRPYCLPGLQTTYGIHFKDFKALDTDGPATRAAFKNGTIQVGLVFSSDGDLNDLGLVVLQDDKHLEAADNVVPILRQKVATDEVKNLLNKIDAALTTADLVDMNAQASTQHKDPDAIAKAYLEKHNYFS